MGSKRTKEYYKKLAESILKSKKKEHEKKEITSRSWEGK